MRRAAFVGCALLIGCSEFTIRGNGDDDSDTQAFSEPVADAGDDVQTIPQTALRLDGTASYDPADYQITAYEWTLVDAPDGSVAELSSADDDRPFFTPDVSGPYTFELTVRNAIDVWDSTPDQVTVDAAPTSNLYAQLSWDSDADLDLHMVKDWAELFSTPNDVCWCNAEADWGVPDDPVDDGRLIEQTSRPFGPEIAVIDDPAVGNYSFWVHYYGIGGSRGCDESPCPVTQATLRLFIDGEEVRSVTQELTAAQQVWRPFTAAFPGRTIVDHGNVNVTSEFTCY